MKSITEITKAGISFAESEGEGVWRTINGSPVFIKEGQSIDEAIAAKFAKAKGQSAPKVFYRGGSASAMPKGGTAADVLKYERDELGNADVKIEPGIDPKNVKAENLQWLTTTRNAARNYGTAQKVELKNYKIIARDSEDGVLVEVIK